MKTKRIKSSKFSAQQTAWMLATAQMDAIRAEYESLRIERGLIDRRDASEEESERVFEAQETVKEALGYYKAMDVLRAAEDALIAWSLDHAATFAPAAQKATVEMLRAKSWMPSVRGRLIDLASKLAA